MRTIVAVCAAASLLALAGCTESPGPDASPGPGSSVVGSIGIQTQSPGAGPSAAPGSATPSPDPAASYEEDDPETPVVDHDIFDEAQYDATQEQVDALCMEAAQWFRTAGAVSREEWLASGTGVYAPAFSLEGYTDSAYESLAEEDWQDFEIFGYMMGSNYNACILHRDSRYGAGVEAVVLTFNSVEPPAPGRMMYQRDGSLASARDMARNALQR